MISPLSDLRAALLLVPFALLPAAAGAQQIESNFEIEIFSGTGLEEGQAALTVYVKAAPDRRSVRTPHIEQFGRVGSPVSRVKIDIDGIPVPTEALAVAIAGQLHMTDGTKRLLPVRVFTFRDAQRRDLLVGDTIFPALERPNDAFLRSFPFNTYSCASTMRGEDLTAVVLASRVMLTERDIYLAQDKAWECLERFFAKNAQVLRGVPSEKLNEVMQFLSDYRIFQNQDVPERFILLYLKFLREIIKIDKMGTQLADQRTLKDQLHSELTEIMAEFPDLSVPFGGSMFDAMDRHGAADLCLDNAETLFFALSRMPKSHFEAMRIRVDDPENALDYVMKEAVACAITEARRDDVDLQTFGPVAGAANWLAVERPDFIQAYLQLYDHLDGIGWITMNRILNDTSLEMVKEYYLELFKAFPRPRVRPRLS